MERHRWVIRLSACAVGVAAVAGANGLAYAQPDPSLPIGPSVIDQLVTSTPALAVDPHDSGSAAARWGGVGMVCENLNVRCR